MFAVRVTVHVCKLRCSGKVFPDGRCSSSKYLKFGIQLNKGRNYKYTKLQETTIYLLKTVMNMNSFGGHFGSLK